MLVEKECRWRIFCMLAKLNIGEDKHFWVRFWWMLVKTFLYAGENINIQFHTISPTYFSKLSRALGAACWWRLWKNRFSATSISIIRTIFYPTHQHLKISSFVETFFDDCFRDCLQGLLRGYLGSVEYFYHHLPCSWRSLCVA